MRAETGKFLVIDLEMCQVPRAYRTKEFHWSHEIIEIGAVLVSEELQIEDKFCCYVKPQVGILDTFIEEMTGIHQDMLDEAPIFADAIRQLEEWCEARMEGKALSAVSWSNTDLHQLKREAESKHVSSTFLTDLFSHWEDCQLSFKKLIHRDNACTLEEALILADIDATGRLHDGLDDAENTALLFIKMEDKDNFTFRSEYNPQEEKTHLSFSLGSLLDGFTFEE